MAVINFSLGRDEKNEQNLINFSYLVQFKGLSFGSYALSTTLTNSVLMFFARV